MALSPNYSWSEPDNSSLVKNGAADIRTLGDAIDTSVWNVGFGQAGKNKIINGDFRINQRNFTSSTTTNVYTFDRWGQTFSDGTVTVTPQTFSLGTAPVAGYEAINYLQCAVTGQTLTTAQAIIRQRLESVRSFAGQTITVSFWAKASSGTPAIAVELIQSFGTGGSPSASVTAINASPAKQTISTSWVRYSYVISVPSISGKTLGTNGDDYLQIGFWLSAGSSFDSRTGTLGLQNSTFQIWGVQAEVGSKATPFQTASGGSPQQELAMCQRYYVRFNAGNGYGNVANSGYTASTTSVNTFFQFPVNLRTIPTAIDSSNVSYLDSAGSGTTVSSPSSAASGVSYANVAWTTSSATAGRFCWLRDSAGAGTGYVGFSAEL